MAETKEANTAEDGAESVVPQIEQDTFKQLLNQSSQDNLNHDPNQDINNENNLNLHNKMFEHDSNKSMYPYRVARLDDICVSFIASNFNEYPILDSIPSQYIENIVNLIDLSKLLINRASKHVSCSKLWERMSCERWENCRVELHGSCWKRLYLEKHINELLESYYPSPSNISNINLNRLLESIKCASPFIHCIKLNQLPSHLDLSQILPLFNNLSSLDITYKILNVGMNYNQEDFGMNLNDALNISKYLQSTKSLSTLILSECLIDDETIHILMGGLQQNNTITTLDLSYNKIGDVGARRLSQFLLKTDNVLMILNLNNNCINDEGVEYIAATLKSKQNTSHLIELDVSLNNIHDDGANHLFEAIAISESVQILNISCNHITNESFQAFINMLKINTSLHTLNISGNPLINSISNSHSSSNTMSVSHSMTNSRPQSRLSHHKSITKDVSNESSRQQTYRSGYSGNSNDSKLYFKELETVLLTENITLINLNVLHIGLSKLEVKTIHQILKPRQVKRKQSQRKNFIDKSWQRLQTVLTIK